MNSLNIIERLERHSLIMTDDECWETDLSPNSSGRVHLSHGRGKRILIHRLAWEAHNAEPIPDGMFILHSCDNPLCFNPSHLRLGTHQENMNDMTSRNRATGPNPDSCRTRSLTRPRNSLGQFV